MRVRRGVVEQTEAPIRHAIDVAKKMAEKAEAPNFSLLSPIECHSGSPCESDFSSSIAAIIEGIFMLLHYLFGDIWNELDGEIDSGQTSTYEGKVDHGNFV